MENPENPETPPAPIRSARRPLPCAVPRAPRTLAIARCLSTPPPPARADDRCSKPSRSMHPASHSLRRLPSKARAATCRSLRVFCSARLGRCRSLAGVLQESPSFLQSPPCIVQHRPASTSMHPAASCKESAASCRSYRPSVLRRLAFVADCPQCPPRQRLLEMDLPTSSGLAASYTLRSCIAGNLATPKLPKPKWVSMNFFFGAFWRKSARKMGGYPARGPPRLGGRSSDLGGSPAQRITHCNPSRWLPCISYAGTLT